MAEKKVKCPNCGTECILKEDGSAVCAGCGGTFTFQEGEARLAGIGEYDQLKKDVDDIKARQDLIDAVHGPGKGTVLPSGEIVPAEDPEEADDPDEEEDF